MEIRLENVSKKYGKFKVIDNISVRFTEGLNILIGHDGAGKSALLKLLVGNQHIDSGNIFFNGDKIDWTCKDFFQVLGYLPSNFRAYKHFTVINLLKYIAVLKGISGSFMLEEILNLTELTPFAEKKIRNLPRALLIRLGIAQSIINDPKVLIMDEPLRDLDIYDKILTADIIGKLIKNRILIISNQLACDFKNLSANYIFMKNGKIILQGKEEALIQQYNQKEFSDEQAMEFNNFYLRTIGIYGNLTSKENADKEEFCFEIGNFRFDRKSFTAFYNNEPIPLTPVEFLIFLNLAEQNGNTVNSENLFTASCNAQYYKGAERSISVHIAHIRKKLSKIDPQLETAIKNIRNSGYVFSLDYEHF